MIWLVAIALALGLHHADSAVGIAPFMVLSPPYLQAGHTSKLNMMLFTEITGNMTVTYFNYTRQYYPRALYTENILKTTTLNIKKEDKILEIPVEVPDKTYGSHSLKFSGFMEGYGEFEISTGRLSIRQSGYKTYVQTDKPLYKPGQPVRFRGFSVSSDLKALELPGGLKVTIKNPSGIKIFDETLTSEDSPIHQGEFLLADEAQIGVYSISVNGRSYATCYFSVEEYVLPKFGVEIEGPGHISADDSVIKGKVTATYTYGKPVSGRLMMTFAIDNRQQTMYQGPYPFHELTMDFIDGKADWEVDIFDLTSSKLQYLFNPWCSPSNLVIYANITDDARGFKVEKTDSSTKFIQSSLKLTFNKNTQKNYVAGFPYYVELDVDAMAKSEVDGRTVKLTMISGLSDLKYVNKLVKVIDGKAFAEFDVPEDACAVKITAKISIDSACDAIFTCFQPERFVSKSDEYIRFVKAEPVVYNGGDLAAFKIISNREPELIHFVILSKGNIVQSWKLLPDWKPDGSGKFEVEGSTIIPQNINTRSRMLALSANQLSGYILADAIDLCVNEKLHHSLDIWFDKATAKPGDNVTLYLSSDPKSFIGLSVTDASLNLLTEPCKVLAKEGTLSFLRGLDSGTNKDLSCKRDDPYQCKSSTKVKIIDINNLLSGEGLQVTTNMNLFNYVAPAVETPDYYGYRKYSPYNGDYGMAMAGESMIVADEQPESRVGDGFGEDDTDEDEAAPPRLRNVFPESWLWTEVISDASGKHVMSVTAPDTITGWVGSAFGLSPDSGLGFSNEVTFQTFLPFFISLDLPYSGKVGERITVPIRIFNYLDTEISADISITSKLWEEKKQTVSVEANKAATVQYTISLTEAGNHEIRVEAVSSQGESDAIEKSLFVQPGGEKITESSSLLIMEKRDTRDKILMNVTLPHGYIPGSHSLKLVAVGDILGAAVSGISNLIQLPSGCGEQNMHKIAINVFSANYLESLYNELPENIDYNIKHNLNIGLQQQFVYRKGSSYSSGGYSVFVGSETSDWLTAFVYKIASQFPDSVYLPCDTFNGDRNYLLNKVSYVRDEVLSINAGIQGWAPYQYSYHKSKDVYWNSYYLISLLESEGDNRCGYSFSTSSYQKNKVGRVCNATVMNYDSADDCCYHHMVVYAIGLCEKHGFVKPGKFRTKYKEKTCLGTSINKQFKFATCEDDLEFENTRGSSKSIEATGYAALYFMSIGNLDKTLPIIMWLANQRNEKGGFRSSQDTVIGLQALAKFAEITNADMSDKTDLTINIGKGSTYYGKVTINSDNKLNVKEVILDPAVGEYKIKWKGAGVAFVQLVSTYHVSNSAYPPLFSLAATTHYTNNLVTVTINFVLPRNDSSTMYLLEVSAVTGSVFTKALIEGQFQSTEGGFEGDVIARYDIKEGGQRLQLYLNPLQDKTEFSLPIPLQAKFEVSNRMPAQITMVDYYTPSIRQTIFYNFEDYEMGI